MAENARTQSSSGILKSLLSDTTQWEMSQVFQYISFTCYFQPRENFNEWRLIYFISFLLLVGFFVLNMFVGVVVENFHRCRAEQEKEERARRAAKRAKKIEERRRSKSHAFTIFKSLPLFCICAALIPTSFFIHSRKVVCDL